MKKTIIIHAWYYWFEIQVKDQDGRWHHLLTTDKVDTRAKADTQYAHLAPNFPVGRYKIDCCRSPNHIETMSDTANGPNDFRD